MVIYIINSGLDPTAKITWLSIVMVVPVLGVLFFIFTKTDLGHRVEKRVLDDIHKNSSGLLMNEEADKVLEDLRQTDPGAASLASYLGRVAQFRVYENTDVTFYPLGEYKWEAMLEELEKAKHFIFMEYFIVEEGVMWGKILEILARKAKEGVDVRVMYDGTCEFSTLPHNYPTLMEQLGIKCKMFSALKPIVSTHYNYRDHRKILVIDGHTAFNGGVNLADEYINRKVKFGHWKDTAVMLKGEAVRSFTLMFLQMWAVTDWETQYDPYLNAPFTDDTCIEETGRQIPGFVIPYGFCPLDEDKIGEMVYMDILNRAGRYVHIMSPYLILDGELETALKFAAERGVDVKIILPGIPDKYIPYALAKTHYRSLLEAGVHIYEYTPGFVHAKIFVSDDREGTVGTINMDYRSLYHHFECGTYMYGTDCLADIEADYQDTLKKCRMVTEETIKNTPLLMKITGACAKSISTLM